MILLPYLLIVCHYTNTNCIKSDGSERESWLCQLLDCRLEEVTVSLWVPVFLSVKVCRECCLGIIGRVKKIIIMRGSQQTLNEQ